MQDRKVTIVVICVVLCVGLLYVINMNDENRYHWFPDYRAHSEQPYGISFIHKMLEGYRPGSRFTVNESRPLFELLEDIQDPGQTDYVLIGENIFLDEESISSLARFIEAGGNAFIATLTPPEQILNSAYFQECGSPVEFRQQADTTINLNFYHHDLRTEEGVSYAYRFGKTAQSYSWAYVSETVFCDSTRSIAALGFFGDNRVNFIKVAVGEGSLYLHSNPLVLTNYFLTGPESVSYAASVFSHLDGKDIIWDEFSKIPFPGDNNSYNNPLYYVLQQPSLKYAWWLLLATVLLYVIFAAKRKQRVIPVLEPKKNTSLEFVSMVSRLHYKNGNHLDMAHKKMKYFLYFVRSRYGIHAEKFGEEQIRRLAEKSKVDVADIKVIFAHYYLIEERFKNNIEANRLVDLYDSIENFYNRSK